MDQVIINQIINSYDQKEFKPSSRAWTMWFNEFYKDKKVPFSYLNQLKKFQDETKGSEADFKRYIDLEYEYYIDPMKFNLYTLTRKEIQRISFNLSNYLNVNFDTIHCILKCLYKDNISNWDFDNFCILSGLYDKKLQSKLLISQSIKQKIS